MRPGGTVTIRAEVADSSFVRRNDARPDRRACTRRSGAVREVPLEWVVDRDGEYQAAYASEETGVHTVRVVSGGNRPGERVLEDSTFVAVADLDAEFYGAEMRRPLLQRIADETGGKFYTPATMKTLPDDIALNKRGVTVVNQMDLWDMPVVLVLLVVPARRRSGRIGATGAWHEREDPDVLRRTSDVTWNVARHCGDDAQLRLGGALRARSDAARHRQRHRRRPEVHAPTFAELSTALAQGAHARAGLADSAVTWLGDTAAPKLDVVSRPVDARQRRGQRSRDSPRAIRPTVVLVLIGHGSGDGAETRVSLPGPDITATDFARDVGAGSATGAWRSSTSPARAATCWRWCRRRRGSW